MKKQGFTLSEVLITLGIIGVIAAMTISSLMTRVRNLALDSQFKKTKTVVLQIILKAKQELSMENFRTYCVYYDTSYAHSNECYSALYNAVPLLGKPTSYTGGFQYTIFRSGIKTFNGKTANYYTSLAGQGGPIYMTNILKDGSFLNFNIIEGQLYVGVDINGYKGPNRLGYDIFLFALDKNDFLSNPFGQPKEIADEDRKSDHYSEARKGNPCSKTSSSKANGIGCSWYALRDECPFDNSKRYFECLR